MVRAMDSPMPMPSNQEAIIRLFRVVNRYVGNLALMLGVLPRSRISVSVESKRHDAFGDHRISKGREFFRIAPERAKAALSLAEIREVKLGDEKSRTSPTDKT